MTLTTQFYTLITMIGMGCCFGASLDTYQYFLKRPTRRRFIVFIHDLLFWFVQALLVFYVLFLVNQGELRFYSFLALICGYAAYQALFKNAYMRALQVVIAICIAVAEFVKKVCMLTVIKPIVGIVMAVIYVLRMAIKSLLLVMRFILRVIMSIIKVILKPFVWIIRRFYKMLPISFTNKFEKLYNHSKGVSENTKNYIYNIYVRFMKKKK